MGGEEKKEEVVDPNVDKKELKKKAKEEEEYARRQSQAAAKAEKERERKLKKFPDLRKLGEHVPEPTFSEMQEVTTLSVRIKSATLKIEDENLADLLVGDLEDWAEFQYNQNVDPENPLRIIHLKDPETELPLNIHWPLGLCAKDGWKLEARWELAPRGFVNEETETRLEKEMALKRQLKEISQLESELKLWVRPEAPEEGRATYFGEAEYTFPVVCQFCPIGDTDDYKCRIGGCKLAFRVRKWFRDTHFCGPHDFFLFHRCRREEEAKREAHHHKMLKYEEDRKLFLEGRLLDEYGMPMELTKPEDLVIPPNCLESAHCEVDFMEMLEDKGCKCCHGCVDRTLSFLWVGPLVQHTLLAIWNYRINLPHVTLFGILDVFTDIAYLLCIWIIDFLLFFALWTWYDQEGFTAIYVGAAIWFAVVAALFFTMCWYFYTDHKLAYEEKSENKKLAIEAEAAEAQQTQLLMMKKAQDDKLIDDFKTVDINALLRSKK